MLEKFLNSLPAVKKAEVEGTCVLGKIFSAAPSFAAVKDSPTFPLDEQQVVLLKKFWRAPNPSKLTAFSEESFKILKVDEEFFDLTKVPTMDDFVKHVNTSKGSTTKEGFRSRIWQNLETDLRKIHRGVRVGLLAQALNQHILSNISQLVQEWSDNEVLSDSQAAAVNQLLLASFDAGNRALEQAARQGGMLHQVRRKVLLEDLQIPKRNRDEWLRLPLSSEGIMGEAFVTNLENMRKMSKEYKASAQQLGLLNNRTTGQKRTFEQSQQSQFKRPFSQPFRGARGSFRGRGSLSGRGRGGNRGAWNQVGRGRGFRPSATATSTSESNQAWLSTGKGSRGSTTVSTFPKCSSGSKTSVFQRSMASYYKRPVGLRAYRKWVFTGIHRFTTPVSRGAKNNVTIEAKRNSKNRSLDPTSKECHSRSAKISPKSRVLQHPIPGSQETFSKIKTGHQSQTPESILGQEIIQNGSLKGHDKSDEAGGLGSVHRSVRCLHAYTNPAKSSEVFEVCRRKPSLAIRGSSVRANDGASNFHKSGQCGCPIFATTRNPDLVISRRLDSDSSGPRPVDRPPKCGSEHIDSVGVSSKYDQVRIDSISGGYFHRSQVSAPEGLGYSSSGQSSEVERDSIHHSFSTPIVSLPFSAPIRSDGVLSVGHSLGTVTNETYPNVSTGSLETQQEGNLGTYPIESSPHSPSTVVVERRLSVSGSSFEGIPPRDYSDNGCVVSRLGRRVRPTISTGLVDGGTTEITHKYPRTGSCDSLCSTIPYDVEGENDTAPIGQLSSSHIHKQTGRHQVSLPMHEDMAVIPEITSNVLFDHFG